MLVEQNLRENILKIYFGKFKNSTVGNIREMRSVNLLLGNLGEI